MVNLNPFRKSKIVTTEIVVGLTSLGKEKAEKFEAEGIKFDVLTTLAERGPCSIQEIAGEVKKSSDVTKAVVKSLIKSGYVRTMSADNY